MVRQKARERPAEQIQTGEEARLHTLLTPYCQNGSEHGGVGMERVRSTGALTPPAATASKVTAERRLTSRDKRRPWW